MLAIMGTDQKLLMLTAGMRKYLICCLQMMLCSSQGAM